MCNYSDFVEQQGLKKGREEGHLESLSESVANLVRSGHFSIEAALDILKVSADIRSTVNPPTTEVMGFPPLLWVAAF